MDSNLAKKLRETEKAYNRLKAQVQLEKKLRKDAEKELVLLEKRVEFWDAIAGNHKPSIEVNKKLHTRSPGTIWLLKSDWHVGQKVNPAAAMGNKYNVEIASKRIIQSFESDLKILNMLRYLTDIKEIIVWLGGDIITGNIHDDITESNEVQPFEQARIAKGLILDGLENLRKNAEADIRVVCNMGNHGRSTKEKRFATHAANSYEYNLYMDLATYHNYGLHWTVAQGATLVTPCQGHKIRTQHGDGIKYQGGIGGLTIPLLKNILRINRSNPCAHDILGDKHTWMPNPLFTVNGSLMGFTEYADGRFENEEPSQGALVFVKGRPYPIHQERIHVE